jgi:hypothetical protein
MIVFLKRLIGTEESQVRERERFRKNLNGFDTRQKEMDGIEDQLSRILDAVEEQQESIRARPSSIISNPPGSIGGSDERPSQT